MNILVVDDHVLLREGIRHLLAALDARVEVIEAPDAGAAFAILAERGDLDLLLLDLALPDARPFDVLRASRRLQPQVPVVVLSSSEERFEIEHAMRLGAHAYVFKSSSSAVLLATLRRVLRGQVVFPRIEEVQGSCASAPALTTRQVEVVRQLAAGLPNREIAAQLGVAANTVKVHLAHVYRALGVSSRTGALRRALEAGLLDEPGDS